MNHDQQALRQAQVSVFDNLGEKAVDADGNTIIPSVPLYNITSPAILRQEQPYNNTVSRYIFEFRSNGPAATIGAAGLSNVLMGDNDIFGMYGIQVEIGVGNNLQGRVYNAFGTTANDNTIYSGQLTFRQASREPVENFPMTIFRDATGNVGDYQGFQFIRPIRKWVGSLDTVEVGINIPNLTGLVMTANQFLRVTLHGALGVA